MELGLEGKRVLVTGSTHGIGLSIAKGFLGEGAKVCLTGRSQVELGRCVDSLRTMYTDSNICGFAGDLLKVETINAVKDYLVKRWDGIDILITNIGSGKPQKDNPMDVSEWERLLQINLLSAVSTINTFREILETTKGNIVMISSIVAKEVFGSSYAYGASKNALLSFMKYASKDLGKRMVRINAVLPGNVLFPGGRWEELINEDEKKVNAMLEKDVPLKRFASPEEIADAVLFLSSSKAGFITGSSLVIDGGQTSIL